MIGSKPSQPLASQDLSALSREELEALVHQLREQTPPPPAPNIEDSSIAKQRIRELTILHSVANACAEEVHEERLISRVTRILSSTFDLVSVGIYLLNEATGFLKPHPAYKNLDNSDNPIQIPLGQGIIGLVAADGRMRNIPAVNEHPHYIQTTTQTQSKLCAPFKLYGRIVGVLNLESDKLAAFTPADERLIQTILEQLCLTIERLRGEARNQSHAQQLLTLNQMAQTLTSSLDLPEVLQRIIDSVSHLVNAEGVVVLLQDKPGQLTFSAVSGQGAFGLQGQHMPDSEGIAGQVIRTSRPIHIRGRQKGPTPIYTQAEQVSGFSTETLLAVPVILDGQTIGVIEAAHSQTNAFENNALTLLMAASHWAAIAIRNAQLFQREHDARVLSDTLRKANIALTETLNLDIVLNNFLEYLEILIPYDGACVLLVKNDKNLEIKAVRGYEDWGALQEQLATIMPISQYKLFQRLLENQEVILIPDTAQEPTWVSSYGLGSGYNWLGIPLVASGKVIGVYSLDKQTKDFFTAEHVRRAETVAAQAAVALENAMLYETKRQQYEQLQQSQLQLIQAEKMGALGRLAASIGHEINNPIQAIQGCLTLVKEELEGSRDQENIDLYMEILNDELSRIANIVQRLRDFYRPAQRTMAHVEINTLVESVLELSKKQFERSHVQVHCQWPEQLPQIYVNPDHLKQVFLNLLLNSLEAMPSGGEVTISAQTAIFQGEGQKPWPAIKLEFSDTGIGMPPDILEQLFEPFTTTKPHGSGLGLSISYGIIQEHSGHIVAESEQGQGTKFNIFLPISNKAGRE